MWSTAFDPGVRVLLSEKVNGILEQFCRKQHGWRLNVSLIILKLACREGQIFSCERSHRIKLSHDLEFFRQWKTGERNKLLPSGWTISNRKDRGGGGAKKIFSLFPSPIPHRLTDGGRKVVTLTRPNETPALQAIRKCVTRRLKKTWARRHLNNLKSSFKFQHF